METRFILPATVATALHALLLFGINTPNRPDIVGGPTTFPFPVKPVDPTVELKDPPPPEPEDKARAPLGTSTVPRPHSEDVLRPTDPGVIVQPLEPPSPPAKPGASVIDPGSYGRPDGSLEATTWDLSNIIDGRNLDRAPRARVQVAPIYPAEARHAGRGAEVVVEFVVDEQGWVHNPRVVRSTDATFDRATLLAVGKWRFEPGLKNNRTVRFRMLVPVTFSLNE